MPIQNSPLDASSLAGLLPADRLRLAIERSRRELELAKQHGMPGAIVRLDVLEALVDAAEQLRGIVGRELEQDTYQIVHRASGVDGVTTACGLELGGRRVMWSRDWASVTCRLCRAHAPGGAIR